MRLTLALGLAGIAASSAIAAKPEPYVPSPPTIVASPLALAIVGFDRDGDLNVSRPEYDWGVSKSFAGFDRDSDSALSLIELTPWSQATLGNAGALPGRFDFDRNGDDKISRDEFMGLFAARFGTLDKNNDSILSRSELVSFADLPTRDRRGRVREKTAPPR